MPDTATKFLKSTVRRFVTLSITGGIFVLAGGAVWQGQSLIAERAAAVEKPLATKPLAVDAASLDLRKNYEVARNFTGQLEALQSADLSFERGGSLSNVFVEEGTIVAKGDLIARLDDRLLIADIDRLSANKRALNAQLELAAVTNKRQAELYEQGFATAQTTDETRLAITELEARVAEVEASLVAARINLEKAELRAPFNGRISNRLLDPGSTVTNGQAVVSILEDAEPVFRVGIDPNLSGALNLKSQVDVAIGTRSHRGVIVAILPELDANTRTRIVRIKLEDASDLPLGSTGTVTLVERVSDTGAWVPLTALEDGIRGLWTIKTLTDLKDEGAKVNVAAVEIIYADQTNAFVRGTFSNGDRYIPQGVHRVAVGQRVRLTGQEDK